jgi:hypothetical protein
LGKQKPKFTHGVPGVKVAESELGLEMRLVAAKPIRMYFDLQRPESVTPNSSANIPV